MRYYFLTSGQLSFIFALILNLSPISSRHLLAEEPTPKPSSSPTNKASDPCKKSKGESNSSIPQQAAEYCAAAEAADEAAKKQLLLTGVHAGVAGICLIPCVNNAWLMMGEVTMGQVCSGAAIGAGVTDMITTKQFTGAVGTLMGAYNLVNSFDKKPEAAAATAKDAPAKASNKTDASTSPPKAEKKSDMSSCLTAAVESGMAIMNYIGHQNSKKTADENRKLAKDLKDESNATLSGTSPSAFSPGSIGTVGNSMNGNSSTPGSASTVTQSGITSGKDKTASLKQGSRECSGSGFQAELQCAKASGVPLPPGFGSNSMNRALEKLSGLPLDKLMAKGDPSSIIGAVAGGALGPGKTAAVQAALSKAEQDLRAGMNVPSSAYSSGGGGGGGGDHGPDIGNALGSLMDSLQNKKEEESDKSRNEAFAKKEYDSDGLEEDRTISIFDRISKRYRASTNRVANRGYTLPQNQVLTR